MNLSNLTKIVAGSAKRLGRGYGSGKGGHTSSRGAKGQKARGRVALGFEGTKSKKSFLKRLPLLRGKGKFKSWVKKSVIIKADKLSDWPKSTPVSMENLIKRGMIKSGERVKILGNKEALGDLDIRVPISGGKITG